ncbi:solute carrier organic anion transporter family member 74D [Onthophagus taurus]|uniref:solute carrier organic anion transporter family member 74D n=1 Tax=Onthophagus taurus TaxID=166361 RepID=UPI000C20F7D7|nr:solute carrier organic anion transporter family member 4C1-like [Onthophagus taurus]
MIHPREIMRTNSEVGSQFSAPINNRRTTTIDCGWAALPCLAQRLNLERWAKAGVFLYFFAHLGALQGVMLSYFRGTAHIWMQHYQYSEILIGWLLYSNEIFVGVFALLISYWGNRIHRVSWLGGLAIFQSFIAIFLVIPETHEPRLDDFRNTTVTDFLCTNFFSKLQLGLEFNYIALILLFLFQLFFGFATISFYTLGLSYIDDNIEKDNASTYLAIPMAAKIFGKQVGLYLSWAPALSNNLIIFTTPAWLVLSSLIFIFGSIITLFPISLPAMALKKAVASLLSLAGRHIEGDDEECDEEDEEIEVTQDGFFTTLWRLLKNPVLMLNIAACTFAGIAFVNLEIFQNKFFQSRFFVQVGSDLSGYQDNLISKIANVIKYPFIATSLIATGFIIAKVKPKLKYIALFNVMIYTITALSFISLAFLSCDVTLQSDIPGRLITPSCSSHCYCPKNTPFVPVCTVEGQKTYFSPCHAGCQNVSFSNTKIYSGCTCGESTTSVTETSATEGACNQTTCSLYFVVAQASIVMASSSMVSTVITNLLINLRVVEPADKAMALALECTFLGILPYVPGKIIYSYVAESLCRYTGNNGCLLNSKSFGLFFSVTTIVLIGIAALISVGVVLLIGDIHIWTKEDEPSTANRDEIERSRVDSDFGTDDNLDFNLRSVGQQERNDNRERSSILQSSF